MGEGERIGSDRGMREGRGVGVNEVMEKLCEGEVS